MTLLETAIGLVFILAFLGLICSAIQEWVSSLTNARGKTLRLALDAILRVPAAGEGKRDPRQAFYAHPLIAMLSTSDDPEKRLPAYIPSPLFATTVIDLVSQDGAEEIEDPPGSGKMKPNPPTARFKAGLKVWKTDCPAFANWLRAVTVDVDQDYEHLKARIAAQFDAVMERASGSYRRKIMWQLFLIGALVATATNADVFAIGNTLTQNSALRAAVVQAADRVVASSPTGTPAEQLKAVREQSRDVTFPLGWPRKYTWTEFWASVWARPSAVFWKALGLAITTVALTLGAPFWFDALKNLTGLRGAGPAPKPVAALR